LVSKLFNVPLLNVTTSFVAEQQAVDANSSNTTGQSKQNKSSFCCPKTISVVRVTLISFISHLGDESLTPKKKGSQQRKVLPAVSTSLALAAGIGLLEMAALIDGSGTLMNIIGIPVVRETNLFAYSHF